MMMCKLFQNVPEEGEGTKKIKISGPELVFGFLLHFVNLLIGITVFALLVKFDPEYASTIEKVRAASGFSVSKMIYFVCPGAFLLLLLLLSALSKLAYHAFAEPWGQMSSSEKWTFQQCVPRPKSEIVSKDILAECDECEPVVHAGEQKNWDDEFDRMG